MARQGHSVRVQENEAQGQNAGHSAHASPRGKQGHQTRHKAKTTKESLREKKNETGFGDKEKRWNTRILGRLCVKSGRVETLREKLAACMCRVRMGPKVACLITKAGGKFI